MTQPNDCPVIKLFVNEANSTSHKMRWDPPDDNWLPYTIDVGQVNDRAEGVRRALKAFVKQCMNSNAGGVQKSGKQLKEMAVKGHDLYNAIFCDKDNSHHPQDIQKWLLDLAVNKPHIKVVVDDRMYIPWGLVFDGDPSLLSGEADDIDISHFGDFWCIKYFVSTYFSRMGAWGHHKPKSVNLYHLLSAIDEDVFTAAEKDLTSTEKGVLDWLRSKFSSTRAFKIFSKGDLLNEWNRNKNDVDMLFFYCHADGTSIAFSGSEKLSMYDIKENLKRDARGELPSPCLVFLNGCSTASGSSDGGFLEATAGNGFCGFIGTEAEVPDLFALRFGLAFLYRFLLGGEPVYLTMDRLRSEHWPLSLLYSTYCYPMLSVSNPNGFPTGLIITRFGNFSNADLVRTKPI